MRPLCSINQTSSADLLAYYAQMLDFDHMKPHRYDKYLFLIDNLLFRHVFLTSWGRMSCTANFQVAWGK